MHRFSPLRIVVLSALLSAAAGAQTYVDLSFSNNVQPALEMYPNNSTLGPYYSSAYTLDFAGAGNYNGTSVDVRVSMVGLLDGESSNFRPTSTYQWVGWIPDYNTTNASDDLGVYYRHDGNFAQLSGGVAWTMSFYEGGTNFTNPLTLPGVRFLIYDHDGEPLQDESIRAFGDDGLVGYQLATGSGIHSHQQGDSWRFDAGGIGKSETGPEGGMILYYQNTSSVRFDMFGTTYPGLPIQSSGIFQAWDGNLSLTNGNTNGFGPMVTVPEPSSVMLAALAAAKLAMRRRR